MSNHSPHAGHRDLARVLIRTVQSPGTNLSAQAVQRFTGAGAIFGRQLRRPYLSSIRDNVCSNSAISDLTFCTVTWSGI